jgi:predicted GNAT family acetyltransferase
VRHDDPLAFYAAAAPVIARNEVEGVALEVSIAGFVRNPPKPEQLHYLATVDEKGREGAACIYGGEIVALGASDPDAARAFAHDLATLKPTITGVLGMASPCAAFLDAWTALHGGSHRMGKHFRQHVLHDILPVPIPSGVPRVADVGDIAWLLEAQAQIDAEDGWPPHPQREQRTLRAIEGKRYWVWDNDGPVSYAGWTPALRPEARIAPVGTPREQRAKGFATALTPALVRSLRDAGYQSIVLATDIDARIPNAIYARIGFRPTTESFRFVIVPPDTPRT